METQTIQTLPKVFNTPFAIKSKDTEEVFLAVCWCNSYKDNAKHVGFINPAKMNPESLDVEFYTIPEEDFYTTFDIFAEVAPTEEVTGMPCEEGACSSCHSRCASPIDDRVAEEIK